MGQDAEVLRRARQKKRAGEALSSAEEAAIRQYHNVRNRLSTRVYYESEEEKADFEALAAQASSDSMSAWFKDHARLGASGTYWEPSYIQGLKTRIDELEAAHHNESILRQREQSRADMYEKEYLGIAERNLRAVEAIEERMAALERRGETRPREAPAKVGTNGEENR